MSRENPPGARQLRQTRPMSPPRGLRALVVEDSEEDARLLLDELGKGGYTVEHRRVGTLQEMASALDASAWDIVLADHTLPGLGPPDALALIKQRNLDIPFIVVSAANGEETAVAAMKAGAHDYIMKGKLGRMLPMIERELNDARERRRAREIEEQLRFERDRAQSYLDVAGVMFVVIGPDMKVQLINRRGCEMLERKKEQIVGKDWFDVFIPPRIREDVRNVFRQLMAGESGLAGYSENPVVTGSGRERTIAWHNVVLRDAAGDPVGTLSSGEDITERNVARNALEASQQTVRAFIESIHDPAMLVDGMERLVMVNQAFAGIMGKPPEELVGRNMYSLVPPDVAARRKAHIDEMFRTGKPADFEDSRDGRHYDNRIYPVFDSEGRVSMATIIAMDITGRKRAESALRESEERYRALFDSSPNMMMALRGGKCLFMNPAGARLLGFSDIRETEGIDVVEIVAPEDRQMISGRLARLDKGQSNPPTEVHMLTRSGEPVLIESNSIAVTLDGEPAGLVIGHDITERRRTEEALRESEEKFRRLFENSPEGVVIVDLDGVILDINDAGLRLEDTTREKVLGKRFDGLGSVPEEDLPRILQIFTKVVAGESSDPVEMRLRGERGEHWIEVFPALLKNGEDVFAIQVILKDITERKRAQEALQKSEKRYRELVDNLSDLVLELDPDGRITYVSPQSESIYGFRPEELVGLNFADFIHPDHLKGALEAISSVTAGGPHIDFEFKTRHKDGHWVFSSASGKVVEEGANFKLVGILKDITERKRADEELEERNRLLATMNELSFDLASLPSDVDLRDFLVRRLREVTGAPAVTFAEYSPADKTLTTSHIEVEAGQKEELGWLLGGPKDNIVSSVSDDDYRQITTEVVGLRSTLAEASLGAIPPPLGDAVQQLLGVDHIIGMAYVVEGVLFGTSLVGVKKGQPDPSFKLLRAFANMAGVSLRRRGAERALGRSEEKYRGLVDNAGAGVVTADVEGNLTFVNDALCRMVGRQPGELLGRPMLELVHPDDANKIMDLFLGALRDEDRANELEFRVMHKDGHFIHIYTSPTLSYENGEITGFNGIMFDVSERKRAQEELAREKKFSDYIIDSVPGTFFVYDQKGHLVRWNKEEEELIGLPPEKIPLADRTSLYHEEDREAVARNTAEVFEKGYAEMEARMVRPDKEVRNFFITGRKMEVGDSSFLVGSGIDVTDRKKAEEALKMSEKRFRLLAENAKDMIYRVRLTPRPAVEYVSPSALALTGYAPEEFYADPILGFGLFPIEHQKEPGGSMPSKEALSRPVTMSWQRKDGGTTWVESVNHPVINAAGKLLAVEGVARDITERKKVEDALRESEEKFRDLAEQSPNMIFINVKGRVVYANRRCEELIGHTRDEFYSPDFDFNTLTAPEHRTLVAEKYGSHLSGREVSPYEYTIVTVAGRRIDAILSTKLITYGGERALLGTITDITERKKAEQALRESEDKFRRLFESSPEGVVMFDLEGVLADINEAGLRLLGMDRAKALGKHFLDLPGDLKEDQQKYTALLNRFLAGEPVEPMETRMDSPNGIRWEEVYPALLYKEGEPQAIQVIIRDITERKEADEKLRASLKEKEVLLKEIHHRVKNNLQIIHSLLNMQSRRVKDRSVLDALRESQNRVRTMALIHERLYRSTDLSEIDFKEYMTRLVGELYMSFGVNVDQIKLELELHDVKLGIDNAIPCGFIVNELVSNSLKHGFPDNRSGSLRIGLDSYGDGTIRLAVGDSGVGLSGELDFRKTQTLGLQLVCTLVDQLRGQIELDRSRGTEFIIKFNPTKAEGG